MAIRLLSCGSYNALILLSDLASQSIHTTVANTKLQWERCQAADYSFMLLTGLDSKESQDKHWWGGETGIRGVGEIPRLKKKDTNRLPAVIFKALLMKWLISKKVRAVNTSSATRETEDGRNKEERGKEEVEERPKRWLTREKIHNQTVKNRELGVIWAE